MQKESVSRSAFLSPRALVTLLLCGAASSILAGTLLVFFRAEAATNVSQRTLTFAERVAYQRAIEEVYWRHRIWPKQRPDAKPSLDAVMSQAQLEKKVADYLRNSQALEDYWQWPLTADQLQAEMDRMAQHTKQPEVLRELFETLGNDPFVIAECLARPVLAERLLTEFYAHDRRFDGESKRSWLGNAETQVPVTMAAVSANYTLPVIASPSGGCTDDTWTPTSLTNAPDPRYDHTAVWTGSEMIIWGGTTGVGSYFNTGGRYNPATDSWTATSTANAPSARYYHTAVWAGSEMIVWGGFNSLDPSPFLNTGGRYNPTTDSWTATSTINAPDGRQWHTAVWTGSEMIVWGGYFYDFINMVPRHLNTGGRYNPSTNSWTATSTTNAPAGREQHTAVWTGNMIVWGGYGINYFDTGGIYNPSTDSWTATSTTGAPAARYDHTAVWTGSQMIVWGGANPNPLETGGRYDPNSDGWAATSTTGAPEQRISHTAVWTGSEMIVWGGGDFSSFLNTGGRYNPNNDSWTRTSFTDAPSGREAHTAVWTNREMIVWGGAVPNNYFNTGGRYCAAAQTPTPTSTPTPTPTATATATPTPTATPTLTLTPTPTATSTPTITPIPTSTPTPTPTPRPTPSPRSSPSPRSRPTPPPRPTLLAR